MSNHGAIPLYSHFTTHTGKRDHPPQYNFFNFFFILVFYCVITSFIHCNSRTGLPYWWLCLFRVVCLGDNSSG